MSTYSNLGEADDAPPPYDYSQAPPQNPPKSKPVHDPLAQPSNGRFEYDSPYRDSAWAVAFLLHVLGIIFLAVVMYAQVKNESNDNNDNDNVTVKLDSDFWGLVLATIVAGAVMSAFWLFIIRKFAKNLIWFTLISSAVLFVIFALMCIAAGDAVAGIIFLIFAAFNFGYIYLVRRRIEFAAEMLRTVVDVLNLYPASMVYAFVSIFAQAVWLLVWVVAAAGTIHHLDRSSASTESKRLIGFLLLISFYWTAQVIKNIVHVTTAGTLATWYFLYPHSMPPNPTKAAFKRATTTSLGSIALGSLIVAVIKALRTVVNQARRSNNDFARACAACLLSCLDQLVQYFNMYAFTQVAIYGKTYVEAARATWDLLCSRGFDAIINDDLIGGVLVFGSFMGGLMVAVFTGVLANFVFNVPSWGLWALVGFLVGFAMVVCCMEVVESSVAALFVCFAEAPDALANSKPDVYARLTGTFRRHYGERMAMLQVPASGV